MKEYSDKIHKKRLWVEVFEKCVQNWPDLETAEKEAKGQELQKKWKNLRTCFKREYDAQTKEPSGTGYTKRRKYMYFNQLLFLRDSLESRETSSNFGNTDNTNSVDGGSDAEESEDVANTDQSNSVAKRTMSVKQKKVAQKSYEERLLKILEDKSNKEGDIDEDKFFLLSLLPAFKKFNEEQKFVARTEIMNVMRRVRLSGNTSQETHGYQPSNQWAGNSWHQNNTAQYYSNVVPEGPVSPSLSAASLMTRDSWGNESEAAAFIHL